MAERKNDSQTNDAPLVKSPNRRKTWFLNGELVRIAHINKAAGVVTINNLYNGTRQQVNIVEFKKKRKNAFTIADTARLLNYNKKSIPRLVRNGILPNPVGERLNGERKFGYLSYYSEEHIWEARDLLATHHIGRPRKDGLSTNNKIPSVQELRYQMGDGMIYYVKNEDGEFVPIFTETI